MKSLDDKVVVLTGAGSGIGRALAVNLADKGALLALSDWNADTLDETRRLLEAAGVNKLRCDRLDVSDRARFVDYAASVVEEFGRVDVVINNAGVSLTGPLLETSYDDFDWLMAINFWGVVHGTKEFLPHLIASGDGHLVNISSLFGLISVPGQSTYHAAKYAVRGFTESVRGEMLANGHPVGVTCVHPGGIKTSIARNGRATPGQDKAKLDRAFDKVAITSPAKAADVIVSAILADKPRVLIGADAHLLHNLAKFIGAGYQRLFARRAAKLL